ncbi:MAG TPA: hypothetical protein DHV51_03105 [Opitutae bacterium]|nr:hypothetical protein [Opitutae bacterium]
MTAPHIDIIFPSILTRHFSKSTKNVKSLIHIDTRMFFRSHRTSMKTITVTQTRSLLCRLINDTYEHHDPIKIRSKRGNVVLMSEEDWESIKETLHL